MKDSDARALALALRDACLKQAGKGDNQSCLSPARDLAWAIVKVCGDLLNGTAELVSADAVNEVTMMVTSRSVGSEGPVETLARLLAQLDSERAMASRDGDALAMCRRNVSTLKGSINLAKESIQYWKDKTKAAELHLGAVDGELAKDDSGAADFEDRVAHVRRLVEEAARWRASQGAL